MTKKHFIALADAIRRHNESASEHHQDEDRFEEAHLLTLTDFLAEQNPRFNRERWLDYINGKCGKNGGKVKAETYYGSDPVRTYQEKEYKFTQAK